MQVELVDDPRHLHGRQIENSRHRSVMHPRPGNGASRDRSPRAGNVAYAVYERTSPRGRTLPLDQPWAAVVAPGRM